MENISNLILVFKFVICYSLLRGKMKGVLFQTILSDRLTVRNYPTIHKTAPETSPGSRT